MGDVGVQTVFEKDRCKMVRGAMVLMRKFDMELYAGCWEELSLMGVTTLFFPRVKMKKVKSLMSLEKIICCGIKDWDILREGYSITTR